MTKRKIQFSLVYRDMFQSSGKFQPRKDQLERIAPVIIKMGCFSRVETNGGAFEQVNLLYGENPNKAVRAFTKPFNEVGIKTHMLDRGLNALRMFPVPADVRRLMYKVKHAQGVDITRIFCGLNDVRNIIPSIKYALEGGMTPQATLCITTSPIHTAEYYAAIADQVIEAGAPEICLKDMAGIGQPEMLGRLTRMIKEKHPEVIIQYHGHSGPGLSMASILEVCKNGADVIDTAIEPLSWGKVHPDIISVQSMLKHAGFEGIFDGGNDVAHIVQSTEDAGDVYALGVLHLIHEASHVGRHGEHAQGVQSTVEHVGLDAHFVEGLGEGADGLVGILAIQQVHLLEGTAIGLDAGKASHLDDDGSDALQLVLARLELAAALEHVAID